MDHGIITALGALLLAFLMGGVTGAVVTMTILVRHAQRQHKGKGIERVIDPRPFKQRIDAVVSDALDRRPQ